VIRRGETVLVEGEEKRIAISPSRTMSAAPADPKRIKAVGIPADYLLEQWK
jgi:hypothetical protein